MRALTLVFVLVVAPAVARGAQPQPIAPRTVAVAPFASTSSDEYQWIGPALADALAMRVYMQPELNGITLRQVNAAMKHDNIDRAAANRTASALRLGRLLGADVMVVGSYEARWPDIEVELSVLHPQSKEAVLTQNVRGTLDELVAVEARAAEVLAVALGAERPRVTPGAFGTASVAAWRKAALGFDILNWQSLAPRAADPNVPLTLPAQAIEQAKQSFVDATALDASYGEAWAGLGIAEALLGRVAEATRHLSKATAVGSGHYPSAVLGAAFVRMRQARWEDAAKVLADAIERHPGFLHARGSLGELYNHLGRRREAMAVFRAYHEVAPRQPWVLAQLGYTKTKMGDHVAAIADTIAAVDLLPESPSLLLQLASRYIDAGKLIGAEDALQQALRLYPDEPSLLVRLGYVYLLQGKDALAIPISEKAVAAANRQDQRGDRGYAHLNLARAYGHQAELDLAFEHLSKAKADGLASFVEVEQDPALEALRAHPRYAEVVR